jgi:hypothetical protein
MWSTLSKMFSITVILEDTLIHQELLLPLFLILYLNSISLANSNPKHFCFQKLGYNGSYALCEQFQKHHYNISLMS